MPCSLQSTQSSYQQQTLLELVSEITACAQTRVEEEKLLNWAVITLCTPITPTLIYDNSCNFFDYCMKACPVLALRTNFKIDGFHQAGHSCTKELHMSPSQSFGNERLERSDGKGDRVNTGACEQLWSNMREHTYKSAASMGRGNATNTIAHFMGRHNANGRK